MVYCCKRYHVSALHEYMSATRSKATKFNDYEHKPALNIEHTHWTSKACSHLYMPNTYFCYCYTTFDNLIVIFVELNSFNVECILAPMNDFDNKLLCKLSNMLCTYHDW